MSDYKILAHVAKEIEKMKQDQAAFLAAGRADNHPEYKHVCGVIRGLSYAERIIDDLVQRMEKNDD